MEGKERNFRGYKVWQDAVAFATMVYEVTSKIPSIEDLRYEQYCLEGIQLVVGTDEGGGRQNCDHP